MPPETVSNFSSLLVPIVMVSARGDALDVAALAEFDADGAFAVEQDALDVRVGKDANASGLGLTEIGVSGAEARAIAVRDFGDPGAGF